MKASSKSVDPRIDAYIARSEAFARPVLLHLRELVHEGCPEVEETMKWSSPSFLHGGMILCGIAAFRAHCTFGFWHKEMEEVLRKDGVLEGGAMGSFGRLTSLADLPNDKTLVGYIRAAAKLNESGTSGRPRPGSKPATPLEIPPDLAAALTKNKAAAAAFEALRTSHRNEYVEWITEAKRQETRQKRLATTLEWLAEGKSRNWKYANC